MYQVDGRNVLGSLDGCWQPMLDRAEMRQAAVDFIRSRGDVSVTTLRGHLQEHLKLYGVNQHFCETCIGAVRLAGKHMQVLGAGHELRVGRACE